MGNLTFNNKEKIGFSVPVEMFRLSADFVDEDNPDILVLNTKAQKLTTVFDFSLKTNAMRLDADTSNYGGNCAIVVEEGVN